MKKDLVEEFRKAMEAANEDFEIVGDVLLVERIPKRETKTSSGLVLASSIGKKQVTGFDSNQPEFVKVLAVGKGFYNDDTGEDVPLDIKPGYVIEVGRHSVNWFSAFGAIIDSVEDGHGIGLSKDASARLRFRSVEAYNKFMDVFYDPTIVGQ